jgi:hypothetical protein
MDQVPFVTEIAYKLSLAELNFTKIKFSQEIFARTSKLIDTRLISHCTLTFNPIVTK